MAGTSGKNLRTYMKASRAGPSPRPAIRGPRSAIGFTLVELLVVLAIIALIAGAVIPSVLGAFGAGADAQAYNVLSAQLGAARAQAIATGTYAGVHVQQADPDVTDLSDAWYAAVMIYKDVDPTPGGVDMKFVLAPGFTPRRLPGSIVFGEISNRAMNAGGDYDVSTDELEDFTTFTVVFSPTGAVVRQVRTRDIVFDGNDPIFSGSTGKQLWDPRRANADTDNNGQDGEPGAAAVVLFDYADLRDLSSPNDRNAYLKRSGQLIPINVYTGQLFPRN